MKKFTSALLAAVAFAGVLSAGESKASTTGFYMGANVGIANTNVKYSYANQGTVAVVAASNAAATAGSMQQNFKSDGKMGGLFGAFAGYGMGFGSSMYAGVELFGGFDTTKVTPYDDSASANNVGFFKSQVKRTGYYGLAPRIGFMLTPSTMAYVRLGVEGGKWQATVTPNSATIQNSSATAAQKAGSNKEFKASKNSISLAPGFGMETFVSKNMFIRAEYSYLFGPKIKINQDVVGYSNAVLNGTNVAHEFKINQHQFKLGLGYKF